MTAQHLLYLTDQQLSAYTWRRGRLAPAGTFTATGSGLTAFAAHLQLHRDLPCRILADLRDEAHHLETIPCLRGPDRQALIARRLHQRFPATGLATAISLDHEAGRRRNERLLLLALTQADNLEPWLACLESAATPLASVHTLSQLGGPLLAKLRLPPQRCLFLSQHSGTLRESFIVRGQALFSRLVPAAGQSPAEEANAGAIEAARLRQYLIGQSLVDSDETLPAFILSPSDGAAALPAASDGLAFTHLDITTVAARLGLPETAEPWRCEALFLHLLALTPPRRQLASPARRRHYRWRQARHGLFGLAASALITGLPFAGQGFYDGLAHREEATALQAREAETNRYLAEASAGLPAVDLDHDGLRRIATEYSRLQHYRHQPVEAYHHISHALAQAPAVELASIDWQLVDRQPGWEEAIAVQGSIQPEAGASPRQVMALFEDFVRALEGDGSIQVTVRRPPWDGASSAAFQAREGQPHGFVLDLVRRGRP